MWPTISNINSSIEATIKSNSIDSMKASNLNAWIRVYSGATTSENQGLIIQSNTDFKLFSAAGEGSSIYGSNQRAGIIGRDLNGNAVVSGAGRGLRPSPVITSFNSKEGQDQISRTCDFSITCFSLEQLELLQTYFMEPGYSVAVEWGWNTVESAIGLVNTNSGQDGIIKEIAATTLNNESLSNKRFNTNGEYDIFLGFIVGSSISNDGENFKVEVKLRGTPSLPTYLQSHNRITKTPTSDAIVDTQKGTEMFNANKLLITDVAKRRFRFMYNSLPSFRQTLPVIKMEETADKNDYINFDKVITDSIDTFINKRTWFGGRQETIEISDAKIGEVEIDREKLFSEHRYIRFGLAVDILGEIGSLEEYKVGEKKISFKIDITNSVIGAFPNIFSTKASKLIIPGFVPDFSQYFLSFSDIQQRPNGFINEKTPKGFESFIKFVETKDLNPDEFGIKEKAKYWGYLKNLFVNFDMFKSKIEQNNKTIREILLDILNEMSSAVNSFWNFQMVENEDANGDIIITIIDENWIGEIPEPDAVVRFQHNGIGSPFLNSTLNISIPQDKANQIILKRSGHESQKDMANISIGGLFSAEADLFLPKSDTEDVVDDTDNATTVDETKQTVAETNRKREIQTELGALRRNNVGQVLSLGIIDGSVEENNKKIEKLTAEFDKINNRVSDARKAAKEAKQAAKDAAKGRLTAFLEKIDVVPNPTVTTEFTIDESTIKSLINTKLFIFCYDDTDFLDAMKNYHFQNKGGVALSHPLPIKYEFTILGNSGIRRGDTFNITGIPQKYADNGIFQVTEVEHTLSNMTWETTVTGQYRQLQ